MSLTLAHGDFNYLCTWSWRLYFPKHLLMEAVFSGAVALRDYIFLYTCSWTLIFASFLFSETIISFTSGKGDHTFLGNCSCILYFPLHLLVETVFPIGPCSLDCIFHETWDLLSETYLFPSTPDLGDGNSPTVALWDCIFLHLYTCSWKLYFPIHLSLETVFSLCLLLKVILSSTFAPGDCIDIKTCFFAIGFSFHLLLETKLSCTLVPGDCIFLYACSWSLYFLQHLLLESVLPYTLVSRDTISLH